ncbi:MAG: sigma-70 family RNA polymerase sigma factor [Planctomycetaceae bacterium]|nr:sigma-70 family RNA polymerase sigma factor [Planctomycetaceae bacterium]
MPETSQPAAQHSPQIEVWRDYLRLMARLQLSPALKGKLDASDIAQQTILMAHSRRSQYRGITEAEWLGWLRSILANILATSVREFSTEARDISKERSLEDEINRSSARLERMLVSDRSSPSTVAIRTEEVLRVTKAIMQLPDDQRTAIELHHLKGLQIADVAQKMDKTRAAAMGLIFRAMERLRVLLKTEAPA